MGWRETNFSNWLLTSGVAWNKKASSRCFFCFHTWWGKLLFAPTRRSVLHILAPFLSIFLLVLYNMNATVKESAAFALKNTTHFGAETRNPSSHRRLCGHKHLTLGQIRHKYSALERAVDQGINHYIIPRFARVASTSLNQDDINASYKLVAESEVRKRNNRWCLRMRKLVLFQFALWYSR